MKERGTKILLGVVAVLLAAVLVRPLFQDSRAQDALSVPPVLRARLIELVDEAGTVRSSLKVEPGGTVVFRLMDAQGTIRVKIGAAEDGSGLLLANDQTEPGVHLLAKGDGTTLSLAEKGKEKRVIRP